MSSLRVGVLSAVLLFLPSVYTSATEPDDLLASTNQFSTIFSDMGWGFPYLSLKEDHDYCIAKYQWWTDFSTMPTGLAAAFTNSSETFAGVKTLPLKLVLDVESGDIAVKTDSGDTLLLVTRPSSYDAAAKYAYTFNAWNAFFCGGYDDTDDCAEGLEPQRLVLRVFLADVNDMVADEEESVMTSGSQNSEEVLGEGESESQSEESLFVYQIGVCGTIPVTSINAVSSNQIALGWQSLTNASYFVQAYTNLEPFPLFSILGTVSSQTSQASYTDAPPSNLKFRFYRVLDASTTLPCVSILLPTNGASVSGLTNIDFYATAIDKIKSTTLIVDGQVAWTITAGRSLPFPSYFFSNGVHTVSVQVTDNGNDENQGTATSSINVTVQNSIAVTWYEAFGDLLPIQATLTDSNANYTIAIRDGTTNVLKTITGSTANGMINTNWDGKNGSGVSVPDDSLYFLTITTTSSGFAPEIETSSTTNSAFFGTFKEGSWNTGKTILEREVLTSSALNAVAVGKVDVSIKASFDAALMSSGVDYFLQHIQNDADWPALLRSFTNTNPKITQFYYTGHASGTKMGFEETTPSTGLETIDVKQVLQNYYQTTNGVPVVSFSWPFKFVFIDGCESGAGDWMPAFGVLNRAMDYSVVHRKQRAFIGWSTIQVNWLFAVNNNYSKFATRFWSEWIADNPNVPISQAIQNAVQAASIDTNKLVVVGYTGLTWSD